MFRDRLWQSRDETLHPVLCGTLQAHRGQCYAAVPAPDAPHNKPIGQVQMHAALSASGWAGCNKQESHILVDTGGTTAVADLCMLELWRVMKQAWTRFPCSATVGVGGIQSCRCCSCMPGSCPGSNVQSGAAGGDSMGMCRAALLRQLLPGCCLKVPVCPWYCSSTGRHLPALGIRVHVISASGCCCCC